MNRRRIATSVWLAAAASVALAGCGKPNATPAPPVPLAERVIEILDMPGDPDWLVAGFGSVWVKRDDGSVARVDAQSHEVVALIDADVSNPGLCQGIGTDGTSIWACSGPDIVRIDPVTNEVADVVAAHKIFGQGRLVHEAGRIWILNGEDGQRLVGVDVATLEVSSPIELGAGCRDLAVGGGSVWAACTPSNVVLRIDPTAGTVTRRIELESPYQVTVGPTAAWAATPTGVARIDLDDDSLTVVAMDPGPLDESGLWLDARSVWVRGASPFLTRIDAATARIVETITAPEIGPGDIVGLDGTLWASDYVGGHVVHLRVVTP